MPTRQKFTQRDSAFVTCSGCGLLKLSAHLNINGECESCSVICENCENPARIVGDLNDQGLCSSCDMQEYAEEIMNKFDL